MRRTTLSITKLWTFGRLVSLKVPFFLENNRTGLAVDVFQVAQGFDFVLSAPGGAELKALRVTLSQRLYVAHENIVCVLHSLRQCPRV